MSIVTVGTTGDQLVCIIILQINDIVQNTKEFVRLPPAVKNAVCDEAQRSYFIGYIPLEYER